MNRDNNTIWEIIERIQNNTASEDDRIMYENWLNEDEENKKVNELLWQVGYKMPKNIDAIKTNAYLKIQTVIKMDVMKRRMMIWRYSAVSSFALLFILSILFFSNRVLFKNKVVNLEIQTSYGQKTKTILPDKSVVYLYGGSSIQYPSAFRGDERIVQLRGEAYFEVEKDTKHPFIVETGILNVKVYGTHFSVKSYTEDSTFEAILVEGSVGLYNIDKGPELLRLKPNQKVVYHKDSHKLVLQNVNASQEISWINGRYYFKRETLSTIARQLERNFNIPIRIVSPELNDRLYAGYFDKNKSIFQILQTITLHSDFAYKLKNDTIIIYRLHNRPD
jgi:ferric-dicitrate binding protein FerR (iron transport regulator)